MECTKVLKQISGKNTPEAIKLIYETLNKMLKKPELIKKDEASLLKIIEELLEKIVEADRQNIPYIFDQIIKSLSFLLVNIKNDTSKYYLFSNNYINEIISKDYSEYNQDFFAFYSSLTKSLSIRLDKSTIQFFYVENTNSFPLVESSIKIYEQGDAFLKNSVRTVILNVLQIQKNNPEINVQDYFSRLPSILFFPYLIIEVKKAIKALSKSSSNSTQRVANQLESIVEEIYFINDLLGLELEKINYIVTNSIFSYLIFPLLFSSLCKSESAIPKNFALFFICFILRATMKKKINEILSSFLFNEELSEELSLMASTKRKDEKIPLYSGNSFSTFILCNLSKMFLRAITFSNNIYLKNNEKFKQLKEIASKFKNIVGEVSESVIEKSYQLLMGYLNTKQKAEIEEKHKNWSEVLGVSIGNSSIKSNENFYDKSFVNLYNKYSNALIEKQENEVLVKSKIHSVFFELKDSEKEKEILLFNMLINSVTLPKEEKTLFILIQALVKFLLSKNPLRFITVILIQDNLSKLFDLVKEKNSSDCYDKILKVYTEVSNRIKNSIENFQETRENGYEIFERVWMRYNSMTEKRVQKIFEKELLTAYQLLDKKGIEKEEDCPEFLRISGEEESDRLEHYLIVYLVSHDLLLRLRDSKEGLYKKAFPLGDNEEKLILDKKYKFIEGENADKIFEIKGNENRIIIKNNCLYFGTYKSDDTTVVSKYLLASAEIKRDQRKGTEIYLVVKNFKDVKELTVDCINPLNQNEIFSYISQAILEIKSQEYLLFYSHFNKIFSTDVL